MKKQLRELYKYKNIFIKRPLIKRYYYFNPIVDFNKISFSNDYYVNKIMSYYFNAIFSSRYRNVNF